MPKFTKRYIQFQEKCPDRRKDGWKDEWKDGRVDNFIGLFRLTLEVQKNLGITNALFNNGKFYIILHKS